ncbi:SDR family NAD(P)-dependent oxidoreductase [Crenobacter luteus]|uniref:SDR family NAD(P)-dependent oxidoreductase n=1 Tax=Crenobacter luteus TaxID=1452487 RepID=UPI0018D479E5|nr:SDR family NAD(P)-dependent oxidoreductase [Crenobacter luteus]
MSLNPPIADWQGRRVWLVGASHGIGAALARRLAGRGAQVAVSGRSEEALAEVAAARMRVLPLDVTDAAAWEGAARTLANEWGAVDLTVMLAGDYRTVRAWELDAATARRLVEVNLLGVMNGVAALMPLTTARADAGDWGIAVVASLSGLCGMPNALVYGATKAALVNFAETLYFDLAPRGVPVYLVNPGFVATRLTAGNDFAMPGLLTPEAAADAMIAGFEAGDFHIAFPRRFARQVRLMAKLPYRAYFPLLHKVTGL